MLAIRYHVGMKKVKPKTIPVVVPEPAVLKKPSKPLKKTGLKKSDPNYYAKIGRISAKKRKLSSTFFSDMAKLSHAPESRRDGYKGGRKKKDSEAA